MKTEKDIAAALRALAEHDARIEASPELEARVLREFQRLKRVLKNNETPLADARGSESARCVHNRLQSHDREGVVFVSDFQQPRKPVPQRRGWYRLPIALAAAMIVVAILALRHPRVESVVKQAPRTVTPAIVETPAVVTAAADVKPARRRARPREVMTPFFPLLDAPPPVDRGELLRVNVPASTMRAVGLPVADDRLADRVQADVLVSEEGLATAIRFVKYE